MDEVKIGEVVMLNSGGPEMTVVATEKIDGVEMISCEWFDKEKKVRRHGFPIMSLKPTGFAGLSEAERKRALDAVKRIKVLDGNSAEK
jgi:uncharacterized protein YodC (DUF2158 family)